MSDFHDCTTCPLTTRRDFLRDAAVTGVGVLALLGMPNIASALTAAGGTLVDIRPLSVRGPLRAYAVPSVDGASIDRDADVILVRWNNELLAFDLACPHQHVALRWDDSLGHFRCPKHHSEYQPTGEFIKGRATRGMDRFPITRDAGQLVVDTSRQFEQDKDPSGWAGAVIRVS